MADRLDNPGDRTLGDLVARLIADGREVARAEIGLYRAVALHRVAKARSGIVALAIGAILLLSALTAIIIGLVLGLAVLIGPVAAGFAVAAALAIVGYVLVRWGLNGLAALSGDEEERKALAEVEALS